MPNFTQSEKLSTRGAQGRAVKKCWKTAGLRKYYKNSGRAARYVTRLRTIDLI